MNLKTLLLVAVALTCGLGASHMTGKLNAPENKVTAPAERTPVIAARLPFGLDLDEIESAARKPARLPFGLDIDDIERAAKQTAVK